MYGTVQNQTNPNRTYTITTYDYIGQEYVVDTFNGTANSTVNNTNSSFYSAEIYHNP